MTKFCTCSGKVDYDSIGIFVELAAGTDKQFHYKITEIGAYRIKLLILLPAGYEGTWPTGIWKIIKKVEAGMTFPVHFDLKNIEQFMSLDMIDWVCVSLKGVTTYVHGVKQKKEKPGMADETWRKLHNAANRAAYALNGRADRKKPAFLMQLDGQMMLDI